VPRGCEEAGLKFEPRMIDGKNSTEVLGEFLHGYASLSGKPTGLLVITSEGSPPVKTIRRAPVSATLRTMASAVAVSTGSS